MFTIINYNPFKKNKDKPQTKNKLYIHDTNIFKSIRDKECVYLNKKTTHSNHYFKDQNGNMCKYITENSILIWEKYIYSKFLKYNIFPVVNSTDNHIIYHTSNLVSLRTFLENPTVNITYILYELFSFINSFKLYGFIHGNLNIDNIFIYTQKNYIDFYVIDFTNSYIYPEYNNSYNAPLYKRMSYLGDYYLDQYYFPSELGRYSDWDFITLYVSLKIQMSNTLLTGDNLYILDHVVSSYININYINNLLKLAIGNS